MPDDITISIDGVEIKTQPGKMVLEAAIDAGVYVPYLCYPPGHEALRRLPHVRRRGGRWTRFPRGLHAPGGRRHDRME